MKILIAIIMFSAIILIHELGHFLLAKINGISVTEFSLGMGQKAVQYPEGRNTLFRETAASGRFLRDGR